MKTPSAEAETAENTAPEPRPSNFIRDIIVEDFKKNSRVQTRFPPEPNGYLHIGHAKAICLDFGLADEFGGHTNLRFDDTNPEKEDTEYVESIKQDVQWLGYKWDGLYYASDYFDQLYKWAIKLIKEGKAYVDDLSADEIRKHRGTLTEPGKNSPYRDRPIEESLNLFQRMRAGEFPDGSRVLRAKIDMAAPNFNMRDPVMYRILHAHHHRTGDKWPIYPMYDFAHGQSDSLEKVTHSMCSLEFADHQPLYNWFIEQLGIFPSKQIEFDRLSLTYTMMSKRKLRQLVEQGHVNGWDDPRMPTLSGMRRRGYSPEAIRNFVQAAGVSRTNGVVELAMLEHFVREDLNKRALRVMAVLHPLKVVIDNYPEGQTEEMDAVNNPEDESAGTRKVPFSRELYIEHDDFREVPPPKYFRLSPGKEVRLRYGYFITCQSVVKNDKGEVVEVHCTYDPATRGGNAPPDGRKVKSTIHWVSAKYAVDAEVRIYENLFSKENPDDVEDGQDFTANLNPHSLEVIASAKLEPSLANATAGTRYQFERLGYFAVDPNSKSGKSVFNRTVALKDTWAKVESRLTPNQLLTIAEDIDFFRKWWDNSDLIDNTKIRHASALLRRLLVEGDANKAWKQIGLIGNLSIKGPDLLAFYRKEKIRLDLVASAVAAGIRFHGADTAFLGARRVDNPATGIRADAYQGFAVAVSHVSRKAGTSDISDLDIFLERNWAIHEYLDAPGVIRLGKVINRREVIKHMANEMGGVHLAKSSSDWRDILMDAENKLFIDVKEGPLRTHYIEMLAIGQSVGRSPDFLKLANAIRSAS